MQRAGLQFRGGGSLRRGLGQGDARIVGPFRRGLGLYGRVGLLRRVGGGVRGLLCVGGVGVLRRVGIGGRLGPFRGVGGFRSGGLDAQQPGHGVAGLSGPLHALVQAVREIPRGVVGAGADELTHHVPGLRALLVGGLAGDRQIRAGLVQPVVGAILEGGELFVLHGHGKREYDQEHADAQREQRHQQLGAHLHAHLAAPQHHHADGPQYDRHQQREEDVEPAGALAARGTAPGLATAAAIGVGALFRPHHIPAAPGGERMQQTAALCLFVCHLHNMPPLRGGPRSTPDAPVSDRPCRPDTQIYTYIIASRARNLKRQHYDVVVLQMCAGRNPDRGSVRSE